jgi:cationic outer membrane protein ompH
MKKIILMLALVMPMTVFAQKFGHCNQQEILSAMPELAKVRGEIEAAAKQYENELTAMQDEFKKKVEEYEKTKATMNATKQQETETSLGGLQQKLQQEKMQPLVTKIQKAIENVGKAGNYVYIMDVSLGIPYISSTLSTDVTAAIKAEMNRLK